MTAHAGPFAGDKEPFVLPLDDANRSLVEQVHPTSWRNPEGGGTYDLIVLGGGTAGLVSAAGAAALGARVALVERALLGGDCLNVGCVPSKALLRSARAVGELRRAGTLGVSAGRLSVDFAAVMERMRRRRAAISPHDSATRLSSLGIEVFFGDAAFSGVHAVRAGERTLVFNRAVIATGARAAAPPVPGLTDVRYLTNETVFWLTELPRRLLILGAGPIGCEMAQAFARFGSSVTVLARGLHVLPLEDTDAAAIVERRLVEDGVRLELGVSLQRVARRGSDIVVSFSRMDAAPDAPWAEVTGDELLVAVGRAPNIESLNLAAAGIVADHRGIGVDDRLRTRNRRVYASGDVCSAFKFTHAADAMSRIVIQNALFYGRRKASALTIPWCTYTDPEVAHVGMNEREAATRGRSVATITVSLTEIDRALLDDEAEGFVRVHHEKGRLLGCTIVASHAGDLIGQISFAMANGGTLAQLSATVHPYPTQGEMLKKAGDAYRRGLLSPAVLRWLSRYFRWTRGGSGPFS